MTKDSDRRCLTVDVDLLGLSVDRAILTTIACAFHRDRGKQGCVRSVPLASDTDTIACTLHAAHDDEPMPSIGAAPLSAADILRLIRKE